MLDFKFSEISTLGKIPENKDNLSERDFKLYCCARALNDWANCYAGCPSPKNFGQGMAAVSKFLGVTGTSESFMEYADNNLLRAEK